MLEQLSGALAVLLYSGLAGALAFNLGRLTPRAHLSTPYLAVALLALALHSFSVYSQLYSPVGVDLGIYSASSVICWVVNIILLASSVRQPVLPLLPPMFAMSVVAILCAMLLASSHQPKHYPVEIAVHILLSIVAYSVLVVTTAQALAVALQDRLLKHHRASRAIRLLPPLRSMEALMFQMLSAGVVLLGLAVISGFFFYQDIKTQHLAHKMLFSTAGLLVYGVLLWGHSRRGWRGITALRLCLAGFVLLMLGYFGSKWVLEILLAR